jgi:urease accessory protein
MSLEPRGAFQPEGETVAASLFAWFSPAFPVGGFAYSHGIEAAAAEGLIGDERGLAAWLEAVLSVGGGWNDAVLLNAAHARALVGDEAALRALADLAQSLCPSRERMTESLGQGEAFRAAVAGGWPQARCAALPERVAYPVAAGAACALIGAPVRLSLTAFLTGFCANLIAAGVRLSLTGQTGGVRILSGLGPVIVETAGRAAGSSLDDLGGCALGSDIASMRHETLNGRLFIS